MHARRKGKSQSHRPSVQAPPAWVTASPQDVEELVVKLAREGLAPSMIGEVLRDEHGVPSVKVITGKGVVDILRERKAEPELPEDLMSLLTKAQRLTRHLQVNKTDRKNKHALELVEAKIHRLAKYYKSKGVLPQDWRYKAVVAQLA